MDPTQLKLTPIVNLPVVTAVANLLAAPSAFPQFQSTVMKTIGDNISSLSNEFIVDLPARGKTLQSIFSPENIKNLTSEILLVPRTSSTDSKIAELYDISIPLSEAFTKLRFETKNLFELENPLKLSFHSNSPECNLNNVSGSSVPVNIFNTPLPLSFIKDFTATAHGKQNTKRSTPTRQPYEGKKEPKKTNGGMGTLFQKFLRRTTQR